MRILLADDSRNRPCGFAASLLADPALGVRRIESAALNPDAVAVAAAELVVLCLATPDPAALEGLRALDAGAPCPVVLVMESDDPAFMTEAVEAGVVSYGMADAAPRDPKPMLRAAIALFQQRRGDREARLRAEQLIEDRAAIDRAKAVLIRERRLSEAEAHRWLQRQAMHQRLRMAEVARRLILLNDWSLRWTHSKE